MTYPSESAAIKTILVFGGARSGKSTRAETLVLESGLRPIYVATAGVRDGEMADRVHHHRERRGPEWSLVEEQIDIADVILSKASQQSVVLIDCLTLWLANLTFGDHNIDVETERTCAALKVAPGPVVLVSNELGMGIVPENKLSRDFRDNQGRLNQKIAETVDAVEFVAAGQPIRLKPAATPRLSLSRM